jgi:hypothetical protein
VFIREGVWGGGERAEHDEYRYYLDGCERCLKEKPVNVFMHLKNGNFELCESCFQWADHEDDYGKEFVKPDSTLMESLKAILRS